MLLAISVLPIALFGLACWQYRKDRSSLVAWRKTVFLVALILAGVSTAVLLIFLVHGILIQSYATKGVDLDRGYPVFSMLVAGLLSCILAGFGRRASRLLLIGDGLVLTYLWYLAGMAASP
jgi:hypothetical protein